MFFDRFKQLCEAKGVSCKKAVMDVGLSNSLATKWKNTGATPSGETLQKLAAYFGVTIDDLLGKEKTAPLHEEELSAEERSILELFRQADGDARRLALLALEHGAQK